MPDSPAPEKLLRAAMIETLALLDITSMHLRRWHVMRAYRRFQEARRHIKWALDA